MSTQNENATPKARLLTKAGLREMLMTRGALDEHRKSGNILNFFKGWMVFGIEGEVLGLATECWLDGATGDLWCHYRLPTTPPLPTPTPPPSIPNGNPPQ